MTDFRELFPKKFKCAVTKIKIPKITLNRTKLNITNDNIRYGKAIPDINGKFNPIHVLLENKISISKFASYASDFDFIFRVPINFTFIDAFREGFVNENGYRDYYLEDYNNKIKSAAFNLGRYYLYQYMGLNLRCYPDRIDSQFKNWKV